MLGRAAGFSLTEILVSITIVVILLSTAMPDLSQWREKNATDQTIDELRGAISMTRSSAVTYNTIVTLCRSNDGEHCQGSWNDGSIIFIDHNADHVLNGDDRLLYRTSPISINGTITFNSFRNRQYLQMTPRGATNFQNGNFTYCPANGDLRLARQIIVSLSGRSRLARDLDGDGIAEDSQGRPLDCD
ncbi:MAG: GspH/FimT family pseudopilin [Pseudohongiellaceae bacterium]